ncbi:hypothetical protein [Paracoccus mutanolyticus]|uniref:hypothetical protein n=1 Tax=Paracoccus mutanolyticus TaxID=1499308 RepID=UPI001673943C|nr:hypothetical protein [Paracoccus mutanolyticus]
MKQVEAELTTQFKIEHPTIGIDWDGIARSTLQEPNTAAYPMRVIALIGRA